MIYLDIDGRVSLRITFEQLNTFLVVAKSGGIRRASERLNLSQPAVTARIKTLEESIGVELFDRKAGMALTKRAERLVRYAEQFVQLTDLIRRDVADPGGIDLHLRIGVAETIVQAWLPEFITSLRHAFPRLDIEIAVDISSNLREALLNRSIDLALLMGPVSEYSVDNLSLPEFGLGWFCAADAALPDDPREIFLSNPVVTYARSTRPYRELKALLFERYGPGVSLFPSSSLSACFRMVGANLGVAALPRALGMREVAEGRMRAFDPGWCPPALQFTASYLGEPQNFLAQAAAETARDVALAFDQKN